MKKKNSNKISQIAIRDIKKSNKDKKQLILPDIKKSEWLDRLIGITNV